MSKRKAAGTYWLAVLGREQGVTYARAEDGYKPCAHPGRYHCMVLPIGPVCPGCCRACRLPPVAGLQKDDELIVSGKVTEGASNGQ